MDQSYSDGDVSLSPSQILERLQMLRQWQLLQRGKLQKQQLQYHETSEITSSITELVSHFSSSTSYNTFRTLLQSSQEDADDINSPQLGPSNILSRKINLQNIMDGISVLNLSGESECTANSPISSRSTMSAGQDASYQPSAHVSEAQSFSNKQISLDEMPILSPKKDFEALISEKLKHEMTSNVSVNPKKGQNGTKPFLKRGQGTARFGLKKNDFKIQNTNSLPWKRKSLLENVHKKNKTIESKETTQNTNVPIQIVVDKPKIVSPLKINSLPHLRKLDVRVGTSDTSCSNEQKITTNKQIDNISGNTNSNEVPENHLDPIIKYPKGKHPLSSHKEKTWAAMFTKEQDDFLRKLKQSAYYKNFASPAKSIVSDISCDEQLSNIRQKREETEQNMFELIENKVAHESFAIDNSFFNRFLRKGELECSGESTPLVLQKCLSKNPNLMHILPDIAQRKQNNETCSDSGTCDSDYTECSEDCSTSCCSCKTVTHINFNSPCNQKDESQEKVPKKKVQMSKKVMDDKKDVQCHNDSVAATNEAMTSNLAEMNSKLLATSELLKDRLRELEDEIETFKKENANLNKMREDIDLERQKFYEEKTSFEQKFNEEKILSEYYLAEEKEKLGKQKQMYERYVREMRGRLSKKDKDEVVNLKKEIHDLKEEIKIKDAKSTSTIARLRNQMRIIEKEKKKFEDEVDKLKKENRRIQHSNEITRRLTNLKYLEQINKKLSNMATKDTETEVKLDSDSKYRSYEIERQSRGRKTLPVLKASPRPRAKSVPNFKVTSRYAKYFSQKDTLSDKEKYKTTNEEGLKTFPCSYEDDILTSDNELNLDISNINRSNSNSEDENNLEKIYNERFKSPSPNSKRASTSTSDNSPEFSNINMGSCKDFFITKPARKSMQDSSTKGLPSHDQTSYYLSSSTSNSATLCKIMSNNHQMPNILTHEDLDHISSNQRTKSPVSVLSNHSSSSHKFGTVINKEVLSDARMIPSPEPTSMTSLTRTNLNPIEIKKPDGTKELKFPNGNIKLISADGKYSKFIYYNGDIKENFYNEGRIKYYYAETKTFHTTHPDGLEVLEFPDGQVEKRYKDGSSEIRLPNGSMRYFDPKNDHVREEWRFPDGAALTVSASGEQRIVFPNGQIEVHAKDHKRREFPDGTIKLVYNDGTSETRYASGRVRIKDKHGNLIMDSSAS